MLNPYAIAEDVAHNCAVADARHASMFSICGLALRLRGLYKWREGLDPWDGEDTQKLLDWIDEKENAWESLAHQAFIDIHIGGATFDPFDVIGINGALGSSGVIYGAGFGQGLAPTFFLAHLKEERKMHDCPIFILAAELARDLMSIPALSQENRIYVRTEVLKAFLWDQIFFVNRSGKRALNMALESFNITQGDPSSLKRSLPEILKSETETIIFHELGEILDPAVDRVIWREILAAFPHTIVELLARTLKDVLADTSPFGRLSFIVKERRVASLAFFVAFFDGFRKVLYPEIFKAFERFVIDSNWKIVEETTRQGYEVAVKRAALLVEIFRSGREKGDIAWAEKEIHRHLIRPLGLR